MSLLLYSTLNSKISVDFHNNLFHVVVRKVDLEILTHFKISYKIIRLCIRFGTNYAWLCSLINHITRLGNTGTDMFIAPFDSMFMMWLCYNSWRRRIDLMLGVFNILKSCLFWRVFFLQLNILVLDLKRGSLWIDNSLSWMIKNLTLIRVIYTPWFNWFLNCLRICTSSRSSI